MGCRAEASTVSGQCGGPATVTKAINLLCNLADLLMLASPTCNTSVREINSLTLFRTNGPKSLEAALLNQV